MIELKNISKDYQYKGRKVEVLKDVSMSIDGGEAYCIAGQSGCGKSTLLHIIGGMLMPTVGDVLIDGTVLTSLPLHFLSSFRREKIGFIFQQFNLLNKFTVMENILFPLVPTNNSLERVKEKILPLLKQLAIDHRIDFPVCHLSGGEQQRVAVARALVMEPQVIVADEPFSNLDPGNSGVILDIFRDLKARGTTFVLSATSIDDEEMAFIDRVLPIHAE